MTREEVKELLPILQAWVDGKVTQREVVVDSDGNTEWKDNVGEKMFLENGCGEPYKLRIKPEPTYRPFRTAEECWNEMKKHNPFGWVKDKEDGYYVTINRVDNDEDDNISLNGNRGWCFDGVMLNFTFADGEPFGIKEKE